MGSSTSKKYEKNSPDIEQYREITKRLQASNDGGGPRQISAKKLQEEWAEKLSNNLILTVSNYLLLPNKSCIDWVSFIDLFGKIVQGSSDEKAQKIICLVSCSETVNCDVSYDLLMQYINDIINSQIILFKKTKECTLWTKISQSDDFFESERLVNFLTKDLEHNNGKVTLTSLETWLHKAGSFQEMSEYVFRSAYCIPVEFKNCLPVPDASKGGDTILTIGDILLFSFSLQRELAVKWRLLFSTVKCGQSWATLYKTITAQGPTLIIIESNSGIVIGGFASTSWSFHPDFFGNDYCFLFTLKPHVNLFESSGYNKNFQYFNSGQATIPNGLGMGGQFDYWGIFISADFGKVCVSKSCTTFKKYSMNFDPYELSIKTLEVWGVGKPDPTAAELGERSGLSMDKDPTATAILELAGKVSHSAEIRKMKPVDEE